MNLDDLLKSIREEDDDSKGGKELDDLLKSIRDEDSKGGKINAEKLKTKTFKNPLIGQSFKAPGLPTVRPVVVKIEPDKLIPKDEDTSKELIEKLDELITVIKADNELEKKEQDYDRKKDAKVKREKREKRIESKKLFSNSGVIKKSVKKIQDIFDTILRFLGFTVLGQIIKFVTDFLRNPKNKEFIENMHYIQIILQNLIFLLNKMFQELFHLEQIHLRLHYLHFHYLEAEQKYNLEQLFQ